MASLILPRRMAGIPPGAVQLSNLAIDRGVERLFVPGVAPRLLSPYGPVQLNTFSNYALTQYPLGQAGAFNGASTNLCENKSPIGDSFRGTLFALCYSNVSGTSATGCVISLSKNGAANPLLRIIGTGSGIAPTGRFMAQLRNAAGGATTNLTGTSSSNPEIVAGQPYLVVLTCEGGAGSGANAARLYVNGVEAATGTAPIEDVMGRDRFTIGGMNRSGFENPWNGGILFAGVGSSPLTQAEVQEMYVNSSWLIQPNARRIWVTGTPSSGTTYIISPTGGATFSGTSPETKTKVLLPTGQFNLSGTAELEGTHFYPITPSGGVQLSGTSTTTKTKVYVPSGTLNFSGTAPMFNPNGSVADTTSRYTLRRFTGRR